MPPLQCGRGHVALKLVCGEYMSSTIVVFDLQFEFVIELITKKLLGVSFKGFSGIRSHVGWNTS